MKKILYIIIATVLCTQIAIAQTALMSDEDHRIMMYDYAVNLNSVLTAELPQGMTIDQFKKKIVNGELMLSSTAQTSILTYAEPLKTYGAQFAIAKNITATTDAEKIFLSSFAPSTLIDSSGNLLENTATYGLTAVDTWNCAIEIINVGECSPFGIVRGNKKSISFLTKTFTDTLITNSGLTSFLLTIEDYYTCIDMKVVNSQIYVYGNDLESKLTDLELENKIGYNSNGETQVLFTSQEDAELSLSSLIQPSIDLLNSYGFSDEDINEVYNEDLFSRNITITNNSERNRKIIIAASNLFQIESGFIKLNNPSNTSQTVQNYDQIYECAVRAGGINAFKDLIQKGIKGAIKEYGVKGVLKVIMKSASKYLGWVGTAWMIYDFYNCMNE